MQFTQSSHAQAQTGFAPLGQLIIRGLEGGTYRSQLDFHPQYYQGIAFAALNCLNRIVPHASPDQPSGRRRSYNKFNVRIHILRQAHLTKQFIALLEHAALSAE